jgi:hypothetical protein
VAPHFSDCSGSLKNISYQAQMSSIAAALMVIKPTVVLNNFFSVKILANTGKALKESINFYFYVILTVMAIATNVKSKKEEKGVSKRFSGSNKNSYNP